jgi:hypothetical protein
VETTGVMEVKKKAIGGWLIADRLLLNLIL